jgi:hypothetical protein
MAPTLLPLTHFSLPHGNCSRPVRAVVSHGRQNKLGDVDYEEEDKLDTPPLQPCAVAGRGCDPKKRLVYQSSEEQILHAGIDRKQFIDARCQLGRNAILRVLRSLFRAVQSRC